LGRLERVDPGFTRDHALSVQLSLPAERYGSRAAVIRFHDALASRLSAVPAVLESGAVSLLPLSGLLNATDVTLPDRPAPPPGEVPQAHFRMASHGYFAAAGLAVLAGRAFSLHDDESGKAVAIVSRTFALRHWPGESAIGKPLILGSSRSGPVLEVVGVVADARQF